MSLNYATFVQRFADLSGTMKSDVNPSILIPAAIDYSEQRLYRELNLITAQVTDTSGLLSSDNRTLVLSTASGTFISVQEVNVLTPSSLTSSQGAVRNKLAPAALNWVNYLYPSEKSSAYSSATSVPNLFAIKDDTTLILGPAPDAAYHVEVIGTIRPSALSASNSSTFLTRVYPDLFVAATMVFTCGYIKDKNIGSQLSGDLTAASNYWESEYQKLFKSALAEDVRVKYNQTLTAMSQPQPTTGGPV